MTIDFVKMNGAGNDFVMIDARRRPIALAADTISFLCDRRRGIGADGVIVLEADARLDFRMRYFNSDGGEAEMCGNGARCAAAFCAERGLGMPDGTSRKLTFSSGAGSVSALVEGAMVSIGTVDAAALALEIPLSLADGVIIVHAVNTGVPHVVIHDEHAAARDDSYVESRGREIRRHERFLPAGTNVNFACRAPGGGVVIRTYERGVERETLACGTGSIAVAVVFAHLGLVRSPVALMTRGGDELLVSFELEPSGARNIVLAGPAQVNYRGAVTI